MLINQEAFPNRLSNSAIFRAFLGQAAVIFLNENIFVAILITADKPFLSYWSTPP